MKTVILVGGSGNRLWPLSRRNYPKQFLKVDSVCSLFQETILRNQAVTEEFILVSGSKLGFTIENHLEEIGQMDCRMLLEKAGRNTAPAITMACLAAGPEEIVLVVPSDHKIIGIDSYKSAVAEALELAEQDQLVTFGIKPAGPNTGYGYIRHEGSRVLEFKEKPDARTAEEYVSSGEYLWNSGMFMFRSRVYLEELKRFRPDILDACEKVFSGIDMTPAVSDHGQGRRQTPFSAEPVQIDLSDVPAESIDFAVMEKSDRVRVVPAVFEWYDVGSFEAYGDFIVKDPDGNALDQNTLYRNCVNVLSINDAPDKLIVVNRLEDLVVVNSSDTVYISRAGYSHEIKEIIVENDKDERLNDYFSDTLRSHRPWGYYEVLLNEPGCKVKRLVVYPGRRLSLQKHEHRSEHWTVAGGEAFITVNDSSGTYACNQSVFIPKGALHRVENKTACELVIIETAIGRLVDESDIIRVEDDFGRT